MFFKRLSRGRSDSYVDDDYDAPRAIDAKYEKYDARPHSSRHSVSHPSSQPHSADPASPDNKEMYPRHSAPQEAYSRDRPMSNGNAQDAPPRAPPKALTAPDLLNEAFNAAVLPYQQKIDQLESQIADLQAWVEQLEQQRAEVHSWIDKRGLRPDVPPSIAKVMDTASPDAATTLNAQLDRKITIVNFDLHRLQDDLNDSISAGHFASAMAKFLPDIQRLSSLPTGPRYAFDLILKLGGNLNSHSGVDAGDPVDLQARRDFYAKLDGAMVEVVQRRFTEGEEWPVAREIKRIEKTAAYLRNYGIEPYFPATLDLMRRQGSGPGPDYRDQQRQSHADRAQGTPPRY